MVTLDAPPLARAVADSRALSAAAKERRLSLTSPTSRAHLQALAREQDELAARIERAIPSARVRWRYRIVLNGLAVALPDRHLDRLRALPGVAAVYHGTTYAAAATRAAPTIPAAAAAPTAGGEGLKIAILDDGVDQTHPYFAPAGYTMPAGFPKGSTAYTTAKVIAARAFAPATPSWRYKATPFDPQLSEHGTHVAGIAAGNAGTQAPGRTIQGVAPRAYIGNYKVLTIPTDSGFGLNGNSPEIAAGIEAAVADGMDVINLSLGEPEIEPSRDLVTRAVDAAADAGVVVTIAAGNEGDSYGAGSVGSPGSAAKAITAAASSGSSGIAGFSAIGPTPLSLRLKPDVAAPGMDILSSVPRRHGLWASLSGTSMAAPYVAGLAALLLEQHPGWTPSQVKSALMQTAAPFAVPPRAGAGFADLAAAAEPLLFASPQSVSFGLVRRSATASATVTLTDAGGGAGDWAVAVDQPGEGVELTAPASATVPGSLPLSVTASAGATAATHTGFVTLTRSGEVRRIPYWLRVSAARLAEHTTTRLTRPGVYSGTTRGKPSLVDSYRYPEEGTLFPGPEQVYRVAITRPVANFGVVLLGGTGALEARITRAGDEDRLVGIASLPLNLNPYQESYGALRPVAGALLPAPGQYDVVFDTKRRAGAFRFRYWVNDTAPPTLKPVAKTVRKNTPLRIRAIDNGSGIDPDSIEPFINGRLRQFTLAGGVISVDTRGLIARTHRLVLRVADYQETRNNENVSRILPNTRTLSLRFRITR